MNCSTSSDSVGSQTSGGRGLHIYLRVEPRWDFIDMRHAAIAFGRELERRAPDMVTTNWWKEERGEKIRRLQPERARPDYRLGVFGPTSPAPGSQRRSNGRNC